MSSDLLIAVISAVVGILGGGAFFYFVGMGASRAALWTATVTVVLLIVMVAVDLDKGLSDAASKARRPVYFGDLIPARDPIPPLPPNVPPDTVQLLLGDDLRVLAAGADTFVFSVRGESFLSIGIAGDRMRLSAVVVDPANQENRPDHQQRVQGELRAVV